MIRIETELFISEPPAKVWAIIMDFDKYGQWNPLITNIVGDQCRSGKLKVKIKDPGGSGRIYAFSPKVISYEENKFFAWKAKFILPNLFDSVHYVRLTPTGAGTTLVQGETFSGLLVKLFGKKFFKKYPKSFEDMNIALAKQLG